jgi:hypothetical protein
LKRRRARGSANVNFELKEASNPRKSHVPADLSPYHTVLEKVSQWPEDKAVNWSELARQCGIVGGNKGQIASHCREERCPYIEVSKRILPSF